MHSIDTHSHFNLHQFDEDKEEAITRMENAGVGTICIGIDEATSKESVRLAGIHESIWACIGQHPTEWELGWNEERMELLAQEKRVVAIGECGLDYYREKDRAGKEIQRELFLKQINLAKKYNLSLMLHIRPQEGTMDAYEDALQILEEAKWDTMRGTSHFFAGNKEIAARFLNLGFHISFSGVITFVPEYEELVSFVPLEKILSETDAPFAAPVPSRGKRNEPAYVLNIIDKIAEIKGVSVEEARQQLMSNASVLFGLNL